MTQFFPISIQRYIIDNHDTWPLSFQGFLEHRAIPFELMAIPWTFQGIPWASGAIPWTLGAI